MNLADFITAADTTRMQPKTRDAARLVLVDGLRFIDAARKLDMKRQQVEEAVARIEAAHKALRGIPEDWKCVTVCVPTDIAKDVLGIEQNARRVAGLSVD